MIDWQAKRPSQVACIAEDLKHSAYGHKAKDTTASTAWRRGMKGQEGHCQSDEQWNSFKDNTGKTSDRHDGAHMGFSKYINTIFN